MAPTVMWLLVSLAVTGDLRIAVEPRALVLGQTTRVQILIDTPADARAVRVTSNVGSVVNLRPDGAGRYAADFQLPTETYPQVAIVAAVVTAVNGEISVAWQTIALSGRGEAVVRTQPFGEITVRIRSQRFGPVKADARGVALVPVVVPPGVGVAHEGVRAIDLRLPATTHLHVALGQIMVRADEQQRVAVRTFAVSPDGSPRRDPRVQLSVTRGELTPLAHLRPGESEAIWMLPPGRAGRERITARLEGEPASVSEADLVSAAGAPAEIAISADREAIVAADRNEVTVRAWALDSAGNRSEAPIAFEASFGSRLRQEPSTPGETIVSYLLPGNFAKRSHWRIRASTSAAPNVLAEHAIPVRPAAAYVLTLRPSEVTLVADGQSSISLRAEVRDRYGNAVEGPLAATAELGQIAITSGGAPGDHVVQYTAPRVSQPTSTRISVRAETVAADSQIGLLPPGSRVAVAAALGWVLIADENAALGLGARGEAALPLFAPRLAGALDAGYFSLGADAHAQEGGLLSDQYVEGSHRFLIITGSLLWRETLSSRLRAWLGAGAGAGVVWSRVRLGDQPEIFERGTAPIVQVFSGLSWHLHAGGPFLEVKYARHGDPSMHSLRGALSVLHLSAGYRFDLW